jgi:hypothetical protein
MMSRGANVQLDNLFDPSAVDGTNCLHQLHASTALPRGKDPVPIITKSHYVLTYRFVLLVTQSVAVKRPVGCVQEYSTENTTAGGH